MNAVKQAALTPPKVVLKWVRKLAAISDDHSRWVHPCTIGQIQHLVHHPALNLLDPRYYAQLQDQALRFGWKLLPCRRSKSQPVGICRRKPWAPMWLLACALAAPSGLAQAEGVVVHLKHVQNQTSAGDEPQGASHWQQPVADANHAANLKDEVAEQRIHKLLLARWQSGAQDPVSLSADLRKMAAYYSQFGEVVELFTKLSDFDWQLRYAKKTFSTEVTGSRLQVDSVNVYFDPRSAAQFKFNRGCADKAAFCVASPADVLLHELLHAHSVLSAPGEFISQGGMNTQMYPFAHERQTLRREQALYAAMTATDRRPRPLRSEHTGRHLAVACATCFR